MGTTQSQEESKMAQEDEPKQEEGPVEDVDKDPEEAADVNEDAPHDDSVHSSKLQSFLKAEGRPTQWIRDRCNGHERVMNPHKRPCCCLLYPNGFLKLFPGLFESNPFMEWFGQVGCVREDAYKTRRCIFLVVMIFSTVGWTCMLLADMSMSKDYSVLKKFGFSDGEVEFGRVNEASRLVWGKTEIHVGVRAVAWTRSYVNLAPDEVIDASIDPTIDFDEFLANNTVYERQVTGFGEFCDGDNGVFFVNPSQCDNCEQASEQMVRGLIMPTIFYFFTFKNDWLRFWPNYDVNCQKVMSFFVGSITIALALRTFFKYRKECFASFREGEFCFYPNGTVVDCPELYGDPDVASREDFDELIEDAADISWSDLKWERGTGYVLLGTAVFVRLFSMLSNLTVPTPSITRNRDEQWEYEKIAEGKESAKSEYFVPW